MFSFTQIIQSQGSKHECCRTLPDLRGREDINIPRDVKIPLDNITPTIFENTATYTNLVIFANMQTIGGLVDKEELCPPKLGGKNILTTWRLPPAHVKLLDGTA